MASLCLRLRKFQVFCSEVTSQPGNMRVYKNSTLEHISVTCILKTMTEKQRQKEVLVPSQQQVSTTYS